MIVVRNTATARAILRFWWDAWSSSHGQNYYEQNTLAKMLVKPLKIIPLLPRYVADRVASWRFSRRLPLAIIDSPIAAILSTTDAKCRARSKKCNVLPMKRDQATCSDYRVCHLTNLGVGMRVRLLNASLRANSIDLRHAQSWLLPSASVRVDRGERVESSSSYAHRPSHVYVQVCV